MSLEQHLRSRLAGRSALLMAHAVVGYPSLDDNWAMLECMQESGVDIVELQLPFSEPIADDRIPQPAHGIFSGLSGDLLLSGAGGGSEGIPKFALFDPMISLASEMDQSELQRIE